MSKSKISGKKLIIQLGGEDALFALWDKGPSFLHTLSLPVPPGTVEDGEILNAEAVRDLLSTALKMPELKKIRNVVFALCSSQVISETISVPEMPPKKLDRLIHANIDMYFPVDMTDYRLVWQTIGSKTDPSGLKEQRVQLWAVPNAILAPYYAVANDCGLSVSAIDYCGNSIASAVGASFSETKRKTHKAVDLHTEISFSRKKTVPDDSMDLPGMASGPLPAAVTDLHLTLDKDLIGLTFVQNGLVVHQRFVRCGTDPAYQFDEVAMMVEYFRSLDLGRSGDFNAMVSGYFAEDSQLVDELSLALDMPLSVFRPEFDPCWIVCAGAAQTSLDFGNPDLNNPVKYSSPKAGKLLQTAIPTAGGAALAGVIALTFVARFSWDATINSMEAKRQNLAIQLQKVSGYADKYKEYSTLYDNYSSDWDVVFNNLRTYNDNLVRVLEELEGILPVNTSVTALSINADGLDVQFACENKEDAAYLIMALRDLQYADLTAISSLSGGGRGAATSYGSGEAAPTEGSDWLSIEQRDNLANLLSTDFGPAAIVYAFNSQADAVHIQGIETYFGAMPSTDIVLDDDGDPATPEVTLPCSTLEQLESIYSTELTSGDSITFPMRKAAITAMMTSNPISFARMLRQINSEGQAGFFYWDMALAYLSLKYDTLENTAASMNAVAGILTTNEQYVKEAEKLIVKNATLQQWYVYYLEEKINSRLGCDVTPEEPVENPIPSPVYLNMQALIDDLVDNGQFNTEDRKLNSRLYGLLSNETLDAIDYLLANKPTPTPPPSSEPTPTPPPTPTPTPTPSVPPTEEPVDPTPTVPPSLSYEQMIERYIREGDSGDPRVNDLLNHYISEGTTKNSEYTTEDNYQQIDMGMKMYIDSGDYDEITKEVVADYLEGIELKNKVLKEALDLYMDPGATKNPTIDQLLNRAVDLYAIETWPSYEGVKKLLDTYYASKTSSGDRRLDKLLKRLQVTKKSTGSVYLDNMIQKYYNEIYLSGDKDQVKDAVENAAPDTRVNFTVSLGYNEELMRAELERKGLSRDSMLARQEVNG